MTVAELIDRIVGAYPGATLEAMRSFVPVFHARFDHREGDKLEAAQIEVFSSFRPKSSQPFPIPADFEAHLPSLRDVHATKSPSLDLAAYGERKAKLISDWWERQYAGIRRARGEMIAGACLSEAQRIAAGRAWAKEPKPVILTAEQIQLCEERAVSSARNLTFGPASVRQEDPQRWTEEMAQVRPLLRADRDPIKELGVLAERYRAERTQAPAPSIRSALP